MGHRTHRPRPPPPAVPAPTLWGPSLWAPLQVCQPPRSTAPSRPALGWGRGGARGRSCLFPGRLSWEASPFPSLALASGSTAAGRLGPASLPPCTPHLWPSCFRPAFQAQVPQGRRAGAGSGSPIPGVTHWKADPPRPPHLLLHLRGCSSLAWPLVEATGHPLGVARCPRRSAHQAAGCATLPDRALLCVSAGLGRRAVPNSEVWRAGLLGPAWRGCGSNSAFSLCSRCSKAMFSKASISLKPTSNSAKKTGIHPAPHPRPPAPQTAAGLGAGLGLVGWPPHLARETSREPGEGWSAEADAQEEERCPPGVPGDPGSARPGPGLPSAVVSGLLGLFLAPLPPLHTGLCPSPLSTRTRVEVASPGRHRPQEGAGLCGSRRSCTPPCRARLPGSARGGLAWPGAPGSPSSPLPPSAALRWRVLPATQLPGLDSRAGSVPTARCCFSASFVLSGKLAAAALPAAVRGRPPLGPPARVPFSWLRAEGPARQIQVDWGGAAEGEAPAWVAASGWGGGQRVVAGGSSPRVLGAQPAGLGSSPRPRSWPRVGSVAGRAVWLPFTLFCPLSPVAASDPSGFLPSKDGRCRRPG